MDRRSPRATARVPTPLHTTPALTMTTRDHLSIVAVKRIVIVLWFLASRGWRGYIDVSFLIHHDCG